jgi:hypothetical protein
VPGATVTVRYRTCTGSTSSSCGSWNQVPLGTTNSSGQVSGSLPNVSLTYTRVEVQVVSVTAPGLTYTGSTASTNINRPS